ncbi:cytochrome c-type biogenesis protein CcmE [Rhodoblastus acidophilus]|uniref:Cytochrome c-type biogenesis protein CcmE n=1 Tax=Rhodoblastus acidophilus TaxID=1074 RepID=A0A212QP24_RHOAC|nr:cytochrome c maturation protein CcmE [Rhodoblastus acidophilus]PPQ38949.1 cytochrome c maturation protein CcmE [Rhodoblastus acidophilus]RAI20114.1 cytochrome c biogenesis protein CcmE [Rhodoblastus acidophilus]SNB60994.1 cytochrome c-type biogenesis protein CcmE [Rhodoblastus acidophilus]
MTRKQKRLTLIGSALGVLALAVGVILFALRDNVVFFYGPGELAEKHVGPGTRLRIGGLVKTGTLVHLEGKSVKFEVTDGKGDVSVTYTGLLPDLFKEGQGVVAEGALDTAGVFKADSILAKHDERYMPREVADALKKQGVWQEGGPAAQGTTPTAATTAAGASK